jgi:hypothetical protein
VNSVDQSLARTVAQLGVQPLPIDALLSRANEVAVSTLEHVDAVLDANWKQSSVRMLQASPFFVGDEIEALILHKTSQGQDAIRNSIHAMHVCDVEAARI